MVSGRLRTVSPPDDELIKLGEELVAWASVETKPPRIRMAQFYSEEKQILRKDWKSMVQAPVFLPYYEKAQSLLAARVVNTDVLDKSYGNRYIRLYDRELVEEENDTMRFKAQCQKEVLEQQALTLVQVKAGLESGAIGQKPELDVE